MHQIMAWSCALHHEHHQIDTFAIQELLFDLGLAKCRAKTVEDIFHEFCFVCIHRVFLAVALQRKSISQTLKLSLRSHLLKGF